MDWLWYVTECAYVWIQNQSREVQRVLLLVSILKLRFVACSFPQQISVLQISSVTTAGGGGYWPKMHIYINDLTLNTQNVWTKSYATSNYKRICSIYWKQTCFILKCLGWLLRGRGETCMHVDIKVEVVVIKIDLLKFMCFNKTFCQWERSTVEFVWKLSPKHNFLGFIFLQHNLELQLKKPKRFCLKTIIWISQVLKNHKKNPKISYNQFKFQSSHGT